MSNEGLLKKGRTRWKLDVELIASRPHRNLDGKPKAEAYASGTVILSFAGVRETFKWRQVAPSPGLSIQIHIDGAWQTVAVYYNPAKEAIEWQRGVVWTARYIQTCLTYSCFNLIPGFPNDFDEIIPVDMPNQTIEFRTKLRLKISQSEYYDVCSLFEHVYRPKC